MELTNFNKDRKRRVPSIDLSTMVYGKIPPQAKELEEAVLGSILYHKDAFTVAAEILKPECFYVDAHQKIFQACQRLNDKGSLTDILTVIEELKTVEYLDVVGGLYALSKLLEKASLNLEDHCTIIKQKFIAREMIRISGETISDAYEDATDVFDMVDQHETKLLAISNNFLKNDVSDAGTLAFKALQRVAFLREHKEQLSGVPTGFRSLDRLTNGWQETDLIILAARPSVGKTAFALNLALNAATSKSKPTPVAFFSLEMSSGQLMNRILSTQSRIPLEKISRPKMLEEWELEKLHQTTCSFSNIPLFIDDTSSLNIFELRAKARKLVSKQQVGLIIVDYLQLMSGVNPDKRNANREQEISNISRNLKMLAKQLNVPIIALSQLSRAIETRKEKTEPILSDLRESGAIEQDADMVVFLYRPDYQLSADEIDPSVSGQAMAKFAKHRNGGLDKIPFRTDLSIQKWFDADFDHPAPSNNLKFLPKASWHEPNDNFDEGFNEPPPF